jgi:hypothetical protein
MKKLIFLMALLGAHSMSAVLLINKTEGWGHDIRYKYGIAAKEDTGLALELWRRTEVHIPNMAPLHIYCVGYPMIEVRDLSRISKIYVVGKGYGEGGGATLVFNDGTQKFITWGTRYP